MKRLGLLFVAGAIALATPAFAQTYEPPQYFWGGINVGKSYSARLHRITRSLAGPVLGTTIDFTSTYSGVVLSSSIAVVGARAGDPCFVGVPTAAAALKAKFGCYVDAADSVKVWFSPEDTLDASLTLVSGTPSTVTTTVSASSVCLCAPVGATAVIAAAGCATGVSSTTLTVTGPNTVTTPVIVHCVAPVDPASGAYFVRVISNQ